MFNECLIIAAGKGERMRPLTDYVPKPLVKYKGKELISYVLDFLKKYDINTIHTTYGFKSESLVPFLEQKVNTLINTTDRDNSYFLFNSVIKNIDEPILLLPCDIIIDIDLNNLYKNYCDLGSPACMLVPLKNRKDIAADFLHLEKNNVVDINREKESEFHASGIQIINPKKINNIITPSDNFYNVWMKLISHKELLVSDIDVKEWEAVDSFNQIL